MTVPLLFRKTVLAMKLEGKDASYKCMTLVASAALMSFGATRPSWSSRATRAALVLLVRAMLPFLYIIYELIGVSRR